MSNIQVNRWNQLECSGCRTVGQLLKGKRGGIQLAKPRILHADFRELDICASTRGCAACQVFRRALLLWQLTTEAHDALTIGSSQGPVVAYLRGHHDTEWLELRTTTGSRIFTAIVALSNVDAPRNFASIPYGEPLNPRRCARLKNWISACHQTHLCANLKYSQRNPTWLIRILLNGKIVLVSGDDVQKDEGGLVPYCCLSYPWGNEAAIKARDGPQGWQRVLKSYTTDVELRRSPFPVTELSETIQDAIAITHNLGIEYLWVDSVCVPRGSWNTEADRMHEVYGNAHFTLSSSGTTKATDRMLTEQDAWRDNNRPCRLYDWMLNVDMPFDDMRLQSPLASRGWILQEERLSPRILYWCAQRAYWSCAECQYVEAKQAGGIWKGQTQSLSHPQRFMQQCRSGDPDELGREWCDIVASYARRSLSDNGLEQNRFAAFSGLAIRYLSSSSTLQSKDEYLAGLWRSRIAQNLAWTVQEGASSDQSLQHVAPSWSWLSLPLRVEMEMPLKLETSSFFSLLSAKRSIADDDEREIVRKGAHIKSLKLRGRFRQFIADPTAVKVPWDGIEDQARGGFDFSLDPAQPLYSRNDKGEVLSYEAHQQEVVGQLDYAIPDDFHHDSNNSAVLHVQEGDEQYLCCLEVGMQAMLLLQPADGSRNVFRRVGVALNYRKNLFAGGRVVELELL